MKERLKSFSRRDACRWKHRLPSKIGMARALFRLEPLQGAPDRVVCCNCEESFSGWEGFSKNPAIRHANVNELCFVGKLGALLDANPVYDISLLSEACAASFPIDFEKRGELAENGFIYSMEPPHVACVGCVPTLTNGEPFHLKRCEVKAYVDKCLNEAKNDDVKSKVQKDKKEEQSAGTEQPSSINASVRSATPSVLESAPPSALESASTHPSSVHSSIPRINKSDYTPLAVAKAMHEHKTATMNWYKRFLAEQLTAPNSHETLAAYNQDICEQMRNAHMQLILESMHPPA